MLLLAGIDPAEHRVARFPSVQGGLRDGRAWPFAAGGRSGELIDVPHRGKGDLGILFLQFPRD